MQLESELRSTIDVLNSLPQTELKGRIKLSITSASELFTRYIARAFLEFDDFELCKKELLRRGERFRGMSVNARESIASLGESFVVDGSTVLTLGTSRVVTALLLKASISKKFKIMILQGPGNEGLSTAKVFQDHNIPTTLVVDAGMASACEAADMVIVGAELVTENGGVVNQLGTYGLALCSKAMNKPMYIAAESYKFSRLYPLTQRDISDFSHPLAIPDVPPNVNNTFSCAVDYTPPDYISLLFTDLGCLTTAAISDELITLYQ
jgi:translation initiation factor eIF-2B subunit alpha